MRVNLGFQRIIIEGDSLSIVKKCKQDESDRSEICVHIRNIKSLSSAFQWIHIQYIEREANRLADNLADKVITEDREFYLLNEAPSSSWEILEKNRPHEPD